MLHEEIFYSMINHTGSRVSRDLRMFGNARRNAASKNFLARYSFLNFFYPFHSYVFIAFPV